MINTNANYYQPNFKAKLYIKSKDEILQNCGKKASEWMEAARPKIEEVVKLADEEVESVSVGPQTWKVNGELRFDVFVGAMGVEGGRAAASVLPGENKENFVKKLIHNLKVVMEWAKDPDSLC